jgi:hypothetical protein
MPREFALFVKCSFFFIDSHTAERIVIHILHQLSASVGYCVTAAQMIGVDVVGGRSRTIFFYSD